MTLQERNDRYRSNILLIGKNYLLRGTPMINTLSDSDIRAVFEAVQAFSAFTPDNDPYGEHDFAFLTLELGEEGAVKIFFKFDYYEPDLKCGAEDPTDESTVSVLTIGFAEEY